MTESSRNLVLCFDGTGNVWKPGPNKTNVVKLVQALIKDSASQLYYYDPGVGTPDGFVTDGLVWRDFIARLSGLIWGGGVWRNVAAGYAFLMRQWRPGDRIFLFGFSRGAFTARAVAGMIDMFGLLRREHENLIPTLISVYKSRGPKQSDALVAIAADGVESSGNAPAGDDRDRGASLRAQFAREPNDVDIHFLGVWDTVESVGLSQLMLASHITTSPVVKPSYRHVRHAVALDERRKPYAPRLFYPRRFKYKDGDTFLQAGFSGAHSDVGGGYDECGLANESLQWIAREAYQYGLQVDLDALDRNVGDPWDLAHDEAASQPAWVVAGAFDRALPPTMFLHESVLLRACAKLGIDVPPPSEIGQRVVYTRRNLIAPGSRQTERRAVPRAQKNAPRQVQPGAIQWLCLIAIGTLVAALASWHHDLQAALALVQLHGWFGDLPERLGEFARSAPVDVVTLLCLDTVLVFAYAAWLPVLQSFLLRLSARDGAASPRLGKLCCYSAGFLPLADLAENALTAVIWRRMHGPASHCLCAAWESALPLFLTAASLAKFACAAALTLAVLLCIAKSFTRTQAGLSPEKILERCTGN
jgi:uncharacterized protein (DUF2235 family)